MDVTTITAQFPHIGDDLEPDGRVLVIADDGLSASLLVLSAGAGLGDRFQWAGTAWEVVSRRPHARALVAHPMAH